MKMVLRLPAVITGLAPVRTSRYHITIVGEDREYFTFIATEKIISLRIEAGQRGRIAKQFVTAGE